jgi:cysteine synthase
MVSTNLFGRSIAIAVIVAFVIAGAARPKDVLRADSGGSCYSSASASASAYDGSSSGSASGDVNANDYAVENCVGLGQTNAIFQAGHACENAGIAAGVSSGIGYAVVSWYVVWQDGNQTVVTGPDAPQQYDCADTFS